MVVLVGRANAAKTNPSVIIGLKLQRPPGHVGICIHRATFGRDKDILGAIVNNFDARVQWEHLKGTFKIHEAIMNKIKSLLLFAEVLGIDIVGSRGENAVVGVQLTYAKGSITESTTFGSEQPPSRLITTAMGELSGKISSNSLSALKRLSVLIRLQLEASQQVSRYFSQDS